MESDDTSTLGPLFETSNTRSALKQLEKDETSERGSSESSCESSKASKTRLPRRWMPTMSPRTKSAPTMSMALMWEMRNRQEAEAHLVELEDMLRAAVRFCPGLPGWSVNWQLSRDPKAGYRVGLVLWMQPDPEPPG